LLSLENGILDLEGSRKRADNITPSIGKLHFSSFGFSLKGVPTERMIDDDTGIFEF